MKIRLYLLADVIGIARVVVEDFSILLSRSFLLIDSTRTDYYLVVLLIFRVIPAYSAIFLYTHFPICTVNIREVWLPHYGSENIYHRTVHFVIYSGWLRNLIVAYEVGLYHLLITSEVERIVSEDS